MLRPISLLFVCAGLVTVALPASEGLLCPADPDRSPAGVFLVRQADVLGLPLQIAIADATAVDTVQRELTRVVRRHRDVDMLWQTGIVERADGLAVCHRPTLVDDSGTMTMAAVLVLQLADDAEATTARRRLDELQTQVATVAAATITSGASFLAVRDPHRLRRQVIDAIADEVSYTTNSLGEDYRAELHGLEGAVVVAPHHGVHVRLGIPYRVTYDAEQAR